MSETNSVRQAALATGLLLLAVYVATAAPSLTFWDASEFATAIATFGIPHPPGTPLYVATGTALWHLLPFLSPVQAGTLLSGLATAGACAIGAGMVTRVTGRRLDGIVAGGCAGLMGTVWMNATETEVYALSLFCVAVQCAAALRAHRSDDDRARVLLLYVAALSIPLHLSALVATPAAWLLANTDAQGRVRWAPLGAGLALVAATIALSRAQVIGAVFLLGVVLGAARVRAHVITSSAALRRGVVLTLVAWSGVAIMLVRARHAPLLNQGEPHTLVSLLDVISRAQYDVAGLWPRRAPVWIQLGNIVQYADWQVALGLWNDVTPSLWRTPFTLLAVAVGILGALAHWRTDRATARAMSALLLLATVGVCVQLNLRAGPSFGIGVLPETAIHEARERDYFYALAFWGWGVWLGVGTVTLVRRLRVRPVAALVLPALVLAGNWRGITRAVWPDRLLTDAIADELLANVPRNALLITAGDNDTYPLWYRQAVASQRPDVPVVVMSLLPADWYLRQAAQLAGPFPVEASIAGDAVSRAAWLARQALDARGSIAVSALIDATTRSELGRIAGVVCWRRAGLVDIAANAREFCPPRVDAERSFESARRLAPFLTTPPRQSPDGMVAAFVDVARCPGTIARLAMGPVAPPDSATRAFLEITCNLR